MRWLKECQRSIIYFADSRISKRIKRNECATKRSKMHFQQIFRLQRKKALFIKYKKTANAYVLIFFADLRPKFQFSN